jgi:xylulokinase
MTMVTADAGPALIGIDVGTSSVKAVMVDQTGVLLDRFSGAHAMQRPEPGAAEQDPYGWLDLVDAALARLAAHSDANSVAAIGITSQVNTHVFCDGARNPLANAITWQDTRSGNDAAKLDAAISLEAKVDALGAPIPIDASHALSRMAWMARKDPDIWANTGYVLSPKDFVIAHLTGETVADPLASIGLVGTDLRYSDTVLELLPGSAKLLPGLRDPLDIAGRVKEHRPFAGVPVAVGTMDAWAAMFGLGVAQDYQAMYLSGTSEVLGLISPSRMDTPGVITFPDWRGITLHAAPTQAGGASIAWLSKLLGRNIADLSAFAAATSINAVSPLFLPHLEGERAPLWDPTSRGGFAGLTSSSGPEEMAASVMEGVAFSARLALEAVEASGNHTIGTLRHGGGGAASDVWCQIRANALGRPLERVKVAEAGATGALAMASVACGLSADLADATSGLIAIDRTFEPETTAIALADDRFAAYQDLYQGLRPIAEQLARRPEQIVQTMTKESATR